MAGLLALGLGNEAQAQTPQFVTTQPGAIVAVGNTLGLAKGLNVNGPGAEDSIGTFISLDPQSVDNVPLNAANPWPGGTTWDWPLNGSTAVLTLPQGGTDNQFAVLYAELIWGGSYNYGTENPTASAHLYDNLERHYLPPLHRLST